MTPSCLQIDIRLPHHSRDAQIVVFAHNYYTNRNLSDARMKRAGKGQQEAPDTQLDGPTMKKRCISVQVGPIRCTHDSRWKQPASKLAPPLRLVAGVNAICICSRPACAGLGLLTSLLCLFSPAGAQGDQIAFCVATSSPLAPKLPLWTDSKATTPVPASAAHSGACPSLNQWAPQLQGNSLSLKPLNGAAG